MKYRILTLDGQILGHRTNKKEALALARQQALQLRASIEIKKRTAAGEYEMLAIVLNPEKFTWEDGDVMFL